MSKTQVKEAAPAAPEPEVVAAPVAPTAALVVETNFDFAVEDNTEEAPVVEVEVVAEEVPLMDGFVQVNYV